MIVRTVSLGREGMESLRFQQGRRGGVTFLGRETVPGEERGDRTIILLDPATVSQRLLSLPIEDQGKLRAILPNELRPTLPRDPSTLLFDATLAGSGQVLAFWVDRAIPQSIVESLPPSVEPDRATIAPLMWAPLIPERYREGTVLLSDGKSAVIFSNGKRLLYRAIVDDLPRELSRTVDTWELGGNPIIDALFLFGEGAEEYGKDPSPFPPETALLPVEELCRHCHFDSHEDARRYASESAVILDLDRDVPIDFLRGVSSSRTRQRIRRQTVTAGILVLILLVLLFGRLEMKRRMILKDIASLDRSIASIYHEVFPKRTAVDEVGEISAEIRRLSEQSSAPLILPTLRLLADGMAQRPIRLTSVEIDGTSLVARGEGGSLAAAEEFVRKLSLRDASLSETSRTADGKVLFTLKGTIERGKR